VISEARYVPRLNYAQKRASVLQKWVDKLSGALRIGEDLVEVSDKSKYLMFFAQRDRAGSAMENVTNFAHFRDETRNFFNDLNEGFGIEDFRRLGVRHFYTLPSDKSFDQLNRTLAEIGLQKQIVSLLGKNQKDLAISLVYSDEENDYRVLFGPVTKSEIIDKATLRFPIPEELPDVGVLIDIDYYCNQRKKYDVRDFIQKAHRCAQKVAEGLAKKLEEA